MWLLALGIGRSFGLLGVVGANAAAAAVGDGLLPRADPPERRLQSEVLRPVGEVLACGYAAELVAALLFGLLHDVVPLLALGRLLPLDVRDLLVQQSIEGVETVVA